MTSFINLENIKKHMHSESSMADVKPASHWSKDVVDMIMNPSESQSGIPIHYLNFQNDLRFRLGEVSIWAGVNGHGKSMVLNQFVLFGMFSEKFGIISPEMTPTRQLQRFTYQACRARHPNPDQMEAFHKYTDNRLWIYDQQGTIKCEVLFACVRYMAIELGIKHVVIDSMMKFVRGEDSYNEQKEFVDQLTRLAKDFNIHVHLVCHSRKSQKEGDIPDKFNIKGSGAITDLVDNVLLVWRNKDKEKKLSSQKISQTDRYAIEGDPDSGLICVKQRHHDWEGSIWLNYHSPSMLLLNEARTPNSIDWVQLLKSENKANGGAHVQ